MANRYWVGGTSSWNATAGSKWSTTSGGAGGSAAPTAADDVYIDLGSGSVTVTVPASTTVVCRSLNFVDGTGGAFTGTFVMAATTSIITIGDGTAGAGNNALKIASGMTWTNTAVGTINFISTSATQQTITTAGKTMPSMVINGVGSSYVLGDALTQVITGVLTVFTLQAGTFDTANYTCTFLIFNTTGAAAKTLTLGSSLLNIYRNATAMDFSGTLPTITANTASFVFKANATMNPAGLNMNGASLTFESVGGMFNHQNGGTWANLTVVSGIIFYLQNAGVTVTGTFTANGAAANNRLLIASIARGASKTITAATVTVTNADFMDINGAGAGDWDLSAITGLSGDCGGNSGITFTTPVTQTATGTSSFTWSTHGWTTRVPLPQDDVVINNAFVASQTITADMPRLGKSIDFTGVTGSVAVNNSIPNSMYGSLTLATSMSSVTLFSNVITLSGRGSHTITSAGRTITNANAGLTIDAPGGTYSLSDALTVAGDIALNNGTLTTNNYAVQSGRFLNSSTASTINLGTTTWTILQAGAASPSFTVAAATTFNGSNSTIVFSTSTSNAATRTFAGGGKTYGDLTYTVAGASGQLSITGNNSFNNITLGSGRAFTPTQAANTVQTIRGNILGSGVVNGYQRMGGLASNYISIPDTAATSITGDITLLGRVAMDSWTPATNMTVVGKSNSSSNLSYQLVVNSSTGKLLFVASTNGTVNITTTSSVATGFTNGTTNWVLATFRASDGRVQFFTASGSIANPAASDFTQLGTDQNNGLSSIFDSTIGVEVGSIASGSVNMLAGKIYRAKIYNGMLASTAGVGTSFGGSVQFDADFTTKTFGANTFTESSSNAATVTITGFVAQAGDGRLTISSTVSGSVTAFSKPSGGILTPSSDYLVVKDIAMVQALSFFAGTNSILVSGNSGVYITAPTYKHVQSIAAATVSGTSISATYSTATTSGNLLIAYFTSSSTQGATFTPPSGWSLAISKQETTWVYIYYKIADGTETSVTFSQTQTRALNMAVVEYTGFSGTPTLDVTDSNGAAGAATTLSTTATTGPTNTAQPALALAFLANASTLNTTTGLTNSFVEDRTLQTASSVQKGAVKELTTTAAVDTTFSWTTSRSGTAVALVVFINTNSFIPQTVFFS